MELKIKTPAEKLITDLATSLIHAIWGVVNAFLIVKMGFKVPAKLIFHFKSNDSNSQRNLLPKTK